MTSLFKDDLMVATVASSRQPKPNRSVKGLFVRVDMLSSNIAIIPQYDNLLLEQKFRISEHYRHVEGQIGQMTNCLPL